MSCDEEGDTAFARRINQRIGSIALICDTVVNVSMEDDCTTLTIPLFPSSQFAHLCSSLSEVDDDSEIDVLSSTSRTISEIQLRSEKNIENRRSNKTKHKCGTKSLAVRVHEHALKNGGQLPKLPEFYKSTHYNEGTGEWIAPKCQTNYEEMVRVDATLNQEGATPLTGEQMSITVLKQRPSYVKGLGLRPSPSIRTTSETALKKHLA
ncbi:uncharacterized protein LOC131326841 [Rhododendron vialii]|uniref:uncharacterized protein LOC131326841 n=1 Tax=Rhododendron vialii TaxID=182163 RepID=UPI00265DF8E1|nr:uncharacterized protein LOC131326841 [Rhododendron vialii]